MGCGSSSQLAPKENTAGAAGSPSKPQRQVGDYKVISNLGQGASCAVFKVMDNQTKKLYALKKLAKTEAINQSLWEHEKTILSKLNNPNVLHMIEAYEDAHNYYIVTVMCEGGELFDRVAAMDGRSFSEQTAVRFTKQLILGLKYCHEQKVAHRDLKPENYVFVTAAQDSDLQLIDFGCAVVSEDDELVKDVCGSPYYIAPEVLDPTMETKRNGSMWRASDMWSIGVCVYLLVTGRPPFFAEDTRGIFQKIKQGKYKMPQSLSPHCQDFIRQLLVMDPHKRLTASQALSHRWLNGDASAAPLEEGVTKALGHFQHATRLKKAVAKAFSNRLSDAEKHKLAETFKSFDKDGDGRLNAAELTAMLGQAGEAQRVLRELDSDGDKSVSFDEFSAGVAAESIDVEASFKQFDSNRDGHLSCEEIAAQLTHLSSEEALKLIREVDTNGDGRISFDEWVAAMGAEGVQSKLHNATKHSKQ